MSEEKKPIERAYFGAAETFTDEGAEYVDAFIQQHSNSATAAAALGIPKSSFHTWTQKRRFPRVVILAAKHLLNGKARVPQKHVLVSWVSEDKMSAVSTVLNAMGIKSTWLSVPEND